MKIKRLGNIFDLNIIAVYKKGKSTKLNTDNIRLVLNVNDNLFKSVFLGNILVMPIEPLFDKSSPMYSGYCGMTNLPMKEHPEFIGDLVPILEDVNISEPVIKHKKYNYYKVDMNSSEVLNVFDELINKLECLSN